jgi:hypothetical protein
MVLQQVGWDAWTGLMWLGKGTSGGRLCVRWWTFGSHKMWGIYWLPEERSADQAGLCSVELVGRLVCGFGWLGDRYRSDSIKCVVEVEKIDFPCVPWNRRVYGSHFCTVAHIRSVHRQGKYVISGSIASLRRCVQWNCCFDTRVAGSNFEIHISVGILEYVGKVDTFQSFNSVICLVI